MYKRNNMLREKRRHANYKPNRRLDAKSSRGMIYENEELRLRTININAEVERGQSEIKSLKRERELLRKEIWTLRDEYDKLERLLKVKGIDPDEFINSNEQNYDQNQKDSEECSSCDCSSNSNEDEDSRNNEEDDIEENVASNQLSVENNRIKSNEDHRKCKERLHVNFDHLSVVSEENLTNNEGNNSQHQYEVEVSTPMSDISSYLHKVDAVSPLTYLQSIVPPLSHFENINYDLIGKSFAYDHKSVMETAAAAIADDSKKPKHFFSPIKKPVIMSDNHPDLVINEIQSPNLLATQINNNAVPFSNETLVANSSFQTGGNLEELLYDIETLSKDILELSTQCKTNPPGNEQAAKRPYRSEISLVLSCPTASNTVDNIPASKIMYNQQNVMANQQNTASTSQLSAKLNQNLNNELATLNSLIQYSNAFQEMNKKNVGYLNNSVESFTGITNKSQSAPVTPSVDRKLCLKEVSKSSISDSDSKINERKNEKNFKKVSYSKGNEPKEVITDKPTVDQNTNKNTDDSGTSGHSHKHRSHSHSHIHSKSHSRRTSLENANANNTAAATNSTKVPQKTTPSISQQPTSSLLKDINKSRKKRSKSDTAFIHEAEAGTSLSERYSNSLASSRESSTSLSSKSHVKRRISITSHGGSSSRIPWCGCWGNGCL